MSLKSLKVIAVSRENYLALKKLGLAGDSFNDVVTVLLANASVRQSTEQSKK
jgi:predicted CopG family antitoxin